MRWSQARHRPDSLRSWLVCFCASVNGALTIGFSLSFGVMLPELMREFNESRQNTAWLGSLTIALVYFLCPLGSFLCQTIGCRFTAIIGGLTCAVGLLLTSYSCSLELMFFTFSFVFGLGGAVTFMACYLITAKNFRKSQYLAVGLVSVGSSIGVLVFGPTLQFLLGVVGWRGTYRVTSAMLCLVCACGVSFSEPLDTETENAHKKEIEVKTDSVRCAATNHVAENSDLNRMGHFNLAFKEEVNKDVHIISAVECDSKTDSLRASNKGEKSHSISAIKDADSQIPKKRLENETSKLPGLFMVFKVPRFTIVVTSLGLAFLGHYTPQLHLVEYCLELGITADAASMLFIVIGLSSVVSRIVTGPLCDISWVNTIYVHQFGVLLVGFVTVTLPVMRSYVGILVFAIFYGVGDGIVITTMNSLLMFTVDEKQRAPALGLASSLVSLSIAGGPPLAGFFADRYDCYKWAFIVSGVLVQFAGILPFALVCIKNKKGSEITKP